MKLAFVVGCARSGTSILGEAIGSHPQVIYLGEKNQHFWCKFSPTPEHHELGAAAATDEVAGAVRKEFFAKFAGFDDSIVIVDKCPPNALRIPFLNRVFPEAKFIHLVRDGRDVACSLLPGVGGDYWGHLKPANWEVLQRDYSGVVRCAYLWLTVVTLAKFSLLQIGIRDKNDAACQIRYENLVTNPPFHLKRLTTFLGLDYHQRVDNFARKISNNTDAPYHAAGQVTWYQHDHDFRIGRHRENLNDLQIEELNGILEPTLKGFGYKC